MDTIAPGIWRMRLGSPEDHTPIAHRPMPPNLEALKGLPEAAACPIEAADITFRAGARGTVITLPLESSESVYGFGLQLKSHRQNGLKKTVRMNSDPVSDTGDSHAPVPFYVSTRGYGVLIDTLRYASFYCGSHPPTANIAAELKGDPSLAPDPEAADLYSGEDAWRSPRPMIVDIPVAQGADVYLFAGPSLLEAVQRYVLFSGGGCLPPLWGLGVWYRGDKDFDAQDALDLAKSLREHDIPCDIFGLEPGWHGHCYPCTYTWNETRFDKPQAFLDEMTELGYRVNLWEHVFVHPDCPLYAQLEPLSGDYPGMLGLVPDLTLADAFEAFAAHHAGLIAQGVRGFKLDECDNSDFINHPWSFPEHTQFPSGLDGEQMHSLLGLVYQHAIAEASWRNGQRTLGQVRASHALAAPLPFVLYSDLYDHRDFIRGVVNCGFSGLLWSPEVRSCESFEDLVRRVQSVVFSPQALINAWYIKNPPWLQVDRQKNNAGEYMAEKDAATDLCRTYFEWRMRLLPYLYAAFGRYHREGVPPFRALVMEYPDDPQAQTVDDAWFMGDDLLVAPLVAGETYREVYLPAGRWYDFWTHAPLEGGQTHTVYAGLDTIPVFVREGAIVPLAEPLPFVADDAPFDLTVHAYGPECRPLTLVDDDGTTYAADAYDPATLTLNHTGKEPEKARHKGASTRSRYTIQEWVHHR